MSEEDISVTPNSELLQLVRYDLMSWLQTEVNKPNHGDNHKMVFQIGRFCEGMVLSIAAQLYVVAKQQGSSRFPPHKIVTQEFTHNMRVEEHRLLGQKYYKEFLESPPQLEEVKGYIADAIELMTNILNFLGYQFDGGVETVNPQPAGNPTE